MTDPQESTTLSDTQATIAARLERSKPDGEEEFGQIEGPVIEEDGDVYLHPHDLRWIEMRRLCVRDAQQNIALVDGKEYRLKRQLEDQLRTLGAQKNELRAELSRRIVAYEVLRDAMGARYSLDFRSAGYDNDTGRVELAGDDAPNED